MQKYGSYNPEKELWEVPPVAQLAVYASLVFYLICSSSLWRVASMFVLLADFFPQSYRIICSTIMNAHVLHGMGMGASEV